MLRLGNKVLLIEVKSYRLKLESLIGNSHEPIDQDLEKIIINPLKQVHDRTEEILQLNKPEFEGIEEIYLMVVSLSDFPTVPILETKIYNTLEAYFRVKVNSFYHLDIEEYEHLCYLIGRKNGDPIFKILNNKTRLYPNICFQNFLSVSHLPVKRMKVLEKKTKEYMEEAREIWFK